MSNNKMAYLIMAHKNDGTFYALLQMLDNVRNDIFIHMDNKCANYSPKNTENFLERSRCFHAERTSVAWGGYSQIGAEVSLLKTAVKEGNYMFYHLLSGEDLPISSQENIYNFFCLHQNKEFIRFEKPEFEYSDRIRYYYRYQERIGKKKNAYWYLQQFDVLCQKLIHSKRNKDVSFQKGSNWFSITDDFAKYVIEKEEWIKKHFSCTVCCDEVFLQTLLINSAFQDRLYYKKFDDAMCSAMRLIDWKRGEKPYVFRQEDYDELVSSPMLFARKFQWDVDKKIIKSLKKRFCDVESQHI